MKTLRIIAILFLFLALTVPALTTSAQSNQFGVPQEVTPLPLSTQTTSTTAQADTGPERPIMVIESYFYDQDTISPGQSFTLYLSIKNVGALEAKNLIFTFSGEDFSPQETGGVRAIPSVGAGVAPNDALAQRMIANSSLWGKINGTVTVSLTYNDVNGATYAGSFIINIPVLGWSGNWKTATPTPTTTAIPRAQLSISGYRSDIDPLQPGSIFNLQMDVRNLGGGDARNVTMILGGGSTGSSPNAEGTPQPGGITGSGADLSVFAPLGSSNVQYLGDIASGVSIQTSQQLIVNVSANPGAYTLKLSFVYSDAKGNRQTDDQIITLLVFQLPQVEVNFYRDPGPISAGMPNMLPIQVVNLSRKPAVMGNLKVVADGAELSNNVSLVGLLDQGGYFTLDTTLIPSAPGPLDLKVSIGYTDDFNQTRVIEQTIPITVVEGAPMGPPLGPDGMPLDPSLNPDGSINPDGSAGPAPVVEETTWDKILRFLKGLIGLDSSVPQPEMPAPGPTGPTGPEEPQPAPQGKGGKG